MNMKKNNTNINTNIPFATDPIETYENMANSYAQYSQYAFDFDPTYDPSVEADMADNQVNARLLALFETLHKASVITGVNTIAEGVCAILSQNDGWTEDSIVRMGRAAYDYTVSRINIIYESGRVDKAKELAQLFGANEANIFERTLGSIAFIIGNLSRKVGSKLHVDIKNAVLKAVLDKAHGFCNVIKDAGKFVIRNILKGASMMTAFTIKVGATVVRGIRYAIDKAIAMGKGLATKVKGFATKKDSATAEPVAEATTETVVDTCEEEPTASIPDKIAKVYQANSQEVFFYNQQAGLLKRPFAPMSDMCCVYSRTYMGNSKDEDILRSVFEWGNSPASNGKVYYSISVGDIVVINDIAYRCCANGWSVEK